MQVKVNKAIRQKFVRNKNKKNTCIDSDFVVVKFASIKF